MRHSGNDGSSEWTFWKAINRGIEFKYPQIAEALFEIGTTCSSETLTRAIKRKNLHVVRVCLEHATPDIVTAEVWQAAMMQDDPQILDMLLGWGARPNSATCPLPIPATTECCLDNVERMLKHCKDTQHKEQALCFAAKSGRKDIVKLLISISGAAESISLGHILRCIVYAEEQGHTDIGSILLQTYLLVGSDGEV